MHALHQSNPTPDDWLVSRELRRKRYDAALALIRKWRADESGYEDRIWPDLVKNIEENRLAHRLRLREQE